MRSCPPLPRPCAHRIISALVLALLRHHWALCRLPDSCFFFLSLHSPQTPLTAPVLKECAGGWRAMAIYRLLQKNVFEPEDVRLMTTVYEDVLKAFSLIERTDPVTELIAKTVIEMVQTGERDPARLKDLTIKAIVNTKR